MNRRSFLLTAIGSFFAGLWPWRRKVGKFKATFASASNPVFPKFGYVMVIRKEPLGPSYHTKAYYVKDNASRQT